MHDGNITALEMLLCQGGDVTKSTDTGKTALHVAASNGSLEMTKLLLKTKLDRNTKDTTGKSALHDTARRGHINVLNELVAAGLSFSDRDNDNEDPLCKACRNGHQDIVQETLRIQTLANPNYDPPLVSDQTEHSSTTQSISPEHSDWSKSIGLKKYLKLAIQNGHSTIAETILDHHSNSNQRPLAYTLKKAALEGDNQLVVSILKQKGRLLATDTFRALGRAASHNHIPVMKILLEEGAFPDSRAKIPSPLLRAIIGEHDDAVRLLIEKGADPNRRSRWYCKPPLCEASDRGNIAIVTMLL